MGWVRAYLYSTDTGKNHAGGGNRGRGHKSIANLVTMFEE